MFIGQIQCSRSSAAAAALSRAALAEQEPGTLITLGRG